MTESLLYDVALSFVPGVGDKTARALLSHFGSSEAAFKASARELSGIDGMGPIRAKALRDPQAVERAAKELEFAARHKVQILAQTSEGYPERLRLCADAPAILYYRGSANLNTARTVAVIGTRKPSDYGLKLCEDLVEGLRQEGVLVVSGLAHGVDAAAHRRAVQCGLPTVGVLAHGLDTLYPPAHKNLAKEMLEAGGLLTDFPSGTRLHPDNFPVRNRIVAGMCDVTVVVESDLKGGSMITAYLAHGYNREVAAFPGRVGESRSAGCNALIRRNVASLITGTDDLLETMGWKKAAAVKTVQPKLALAFSAEERAVVDALEGKDRVHADDLLLTTGLGASLLAATLLQLELQGIVRSMAGKWYRIG